MDLLLQAVTRDAVLNSHRQRPRTYQLFCQLLKWGRPFGGSQPLGDKRLVSVPGIGPIISSAMVAAIGTGDAFSKGRDFAAWLRVVQTDCDWQ